MTNKTYKYQYIVALMLVFFAVSTRMLPHPPNVAPIAAVAIFSGAFLPRKIALWIPLAAIMLSDIFIGLHSLALVTWGSFSLMAVLSSFYLVNKRGFARVVGMSLSSSTLFFLITNFAVWIEGFLYPRTFDGLALSYFMALPFYRNTLIGDLIFTGALFGLYATVMYLGNIFSLFKDNKNYSK